MATLFVIRGSHVRAGFRRIFAVALVLGSILPFLSVAQTVVSGVITSDTYWNLEGSPYIVSNDVVLQSGAKLSIDPGVTVYMGANANLLVQSGGISALGTKQNRIHVLSRKVNQGLNAAPGDWGQWVFLPGTVDTRLEHVLIEHGRGLVVNGSSPVFNNIDLRAHAGAAITVDLEASPSGYGIQASGNTINGITVPAGDITGNIQWNLRGIPYLVHEGVVSVGVSPGIASVTPSVVEQGQTATLTLTGTRLETLSALFTDNDALTFDVFSGGSSTQRFVQVHVAPDALSGLARLLGKTDAGEIMADGLLSISAPAPAITALTPTRIFTGEANIEISIQGRNFNPASEVVINAATVTTRFVSESELVASLPTQSSPGQLNVQVRTPNAQNAGQYVYSNTLILTVDAWEPPLVSITPTPVALPPDGRPHNIVVRLSKADHRAHTLNLSVSDPTRADISPVSVTIPAGETEATVGIRPLAAGTTTLIVDSATLARVSVPLFITADFSGISIAYANPVGVVFGDEAIDPVSQQLTLVPAPVGVAVGAVLKGTTPRAWTVSSETSLAISGIGIPSDATVKIHPADGVVLGEAVTDDSHEHLTVQVTTAPDAPTGQRRLIVLDATGHNLVFSDPARAVVEIFPEIPVIESVTPAYALPGTTVTLSVRGRNLKGSSLRILPENGIYIEPGIQVSAGGDEMTFRVAVLAEAAPGVRVVQITSPVGATPETADSSNTFTIASYVGGTVTPIVSPPVGVVVGDADQSFAREEIRSPNSMPVGVIAGAGITGVAPGSGIIGSEVEVTVRGIGLDAVNVVSFTPDTGLATGALHVNDNGTELRFTVQLAEDAPLGYRRLVLTALDRPLTFDKVTDGVFLVTEPVPELDSVTPQVLVAGQPTAKMTVRGRNFRNFTNVRIVPPVDVQFSGPFETNEDGTELEFLVTVGGTAAPGERVVIVATPAGESPAILGAGNLVRIAHETGPTYGGIASLPVGVMVGSDNTGESTQKTTDFLISSIPVGVLTPETAISRTQDRAIMSAPVGVIAGSAALSIQPGGWLRGASGQITVTGHGLGAVTSSSVSPATGLLIGSPAVNENGTSLTLSIAVAPDAETIPRDLRLLSADGAEVVFVDAASGKFGIGAVPSLVSVSPIVLAQGQSYLLTVRGANLRSVNGIEALSASGAAGLRFTNKEIVWKSDGSGESITVPVFVEFSAVPGNRVLRLLVPGGATASEPTPFNTITVVPQ